MELTTIPDTPAYRLRIAGYGADLAELGGFIPPTPHVVLFLAIDATQLPGPQVVEIARRLIQAGVVYVCAWGPDAGRIESCFDEAAVDLNPSETADNVIITTTHGDESLEEALWFAVAAAYPASNYAQTCGAVVAVAIGNRDWYQRIQTYLGLDKVSKPDEA